jgi:hypothetical protein
VGCGKAQAIEQRRSNPPDRILPKIATIGRIYDVISLHRSSVIFMGIFSQFSVARELLQRGDLEQALAEVDRMECGERC